MRFIKSTLAAVIWSKIRIAGILLLFVFLSGCSRINIEAAKSLSATGREAALQTQQNVLVSYKEYLRARDCEAFQHGLSGNTKSEAYEEILNNYSEIQQELTKRSIVFEKLADLYDAFGELSGFDAGGQTENALGDLSVAVNEYATVFHQKPLISDKTTDVISKIGGLVATEIQKAKIKKASALIQERVKALVGLFENPLVREQLAGYRQRLTKNRKEAFLKLWEAGVYDPKPILDDFGEDVGLTAQKEAPGIINSKPNLGKAITEVLDKRLEMKSELIQEGYDAGLKALKQLVTEHKKLEQGKPLDLTYLRTITAELRNIAGLLAKTKSNVPANQ